MQSGLSATVSVTDAASVAFTNTYESSHGGGGSHHDNYGNLTVSKTVTGNAGDVNHEFTFTVKLDRTVSGQYGDMRFDKGVAVIKLKHGESSTAKRLPEGIRYSVTESDNEGYTVSAVGDNGSIRSGKTAVAAFTNNKDVTPVTPDTPKTPDKPNTPTTSDTPNTPNTPDNPTTSTTPNKQPTTKPVDAVPQTGDESTVGLWFGLMILSFIAFMGVCICGKKHCYTGNPTRKQKHE